METGLLSLAYTVFRMGSSAPFVEASQATFLGLELRDLHGDFDFFGCENSAVVFR